MKPETTLDSRFSDADAVPLPWEQALSRIQAAELFWITTVRENGRPHQTPLVAVWHDDQLHFCTGPEEQKAVNLRHNPRVLLTTGCNTWDTGVDIVVEGTATRVTDAGTLALLAAKWADKWDGSWRYEPSADGFRHPGGGTAHVYAVALVKAFAFGKGTFSQTRYRF